MTISQQQIVSKSERTSERSVHTSANAYKNETLDETCVRLGKRS